MRQREDPDLAEILSRVRVGEHTEADCAALKALENNNTLPDDCLSIFYTNHQVNEYNEKQLRKLTSKKYVIKAQDSRRDKETGRAVIKHTKVDM